MSLFNLSLVNDTLKPIDESKFPKADDWKYDFMQAVSAETNRNSSQFYPLYQINYVQRISCIAAAIISVLVVGLIALLSCASLNIVSSITFVWVILVPLVLLSGGFVILYFLSKKIDVLAGTVIKPFGKRLWAPMPVWEKNKNISFDKELLSYIDLSTLNELNSGIALAYHFPKDCNIRGSIFILTLSAIPWVVIIRMVYNVIRFLVIPFYILFQMIQQYWGRTSNIDNQEKFIYQDILREAARSLCDCLAAPFYGSAYMTALFYSLLDPLAGRVAIAALERDWNKDIIRSRSIWICFVQRFFKLEGGGTRLGLGQHGFYLMGCAQPHSVFLFKNGKIISVAGPSIQTVNRDLARKFPAIMLDKYHQK